MNFLERLRLGAARLRQESEPMNFIGVLKKIGHGAEVVGEDVLKVAGPALSTAAAIDPALAPVASLVAGISRAVLAAQSPAGPSNPLTSGPAKKDSVLSTVEAISPVLFELLLAKTGHGVTDNARFQTGVDQVIEGVLDIYKSFGAVPSSAPAATVAQTFGTPEVLVSPKVFPVGGTLSNLVASEPNTRDLPPSLKV